MQFKVQGDVDEATVKRLVGKSPVFDALANPVKLTIEVQQV
jgi:hypothetical protein